MDFVVTFFIPFEYLKAFMIILKTYIINLSFSFYFFKSTGFFFLENMEIVNHFLDNLLSSFHFAIVIASICFLMLSVDSGSIQSILAQVH